MLNPSTADAHSDDPTITRCQGFAKRWGYAELRVVNLFALRATQPATLYRTRDPALLVGRNNDAVVKRLCRQADRVVAAWGNHGHLHGRAEAVLAMLPEVAWHCLGTTQSGHPRHPGRIRSDTQLRPFPHHDEVGP